LNFVCKTATKTTILLPVATIAATAFATSTHYDEVVASNLDRKGLAMSKARFWIALLGVLLLSILGIASASIIFAHNAIVQQQHCVAEVQSISVEVIPLAPPSRMECFDTPAEAAEFATGGTIKPDRSATSEEISLLIGEHYDRSERH
jgi:hypothetical protein